MRKHFSPLVTWSLLIVMMALGPVPAAVAVALTRDGEAQLPIVLGPDLSDEPAPHHELHSRIQRAFDGLEVPTHGERVRTAAETLADYLQRISGGEFEIVHGNGEEGIALGVYTDFPALGLDDRFDGTDVWRTEEYLIQAHDDGLRLIGATPLAVEHAVWDLLYRLGHRQYFPGPNWEVVPEQANLDVTIDTFESPDYHARVLRYDLLDYSREAGRDWAARNRAVWGFKLNTTHEYNRIRSRNREAFAENHDFFAEVDGRREPRSHAKFNVANPDLRQLVVDDAIRWFENHPHEVSKSMDASDHRGWSESEESAEIGPPSDQVVLLANLVAEAVNDYFDEDKYIGIYAYNNYTTPPENRDVHPHLIVSFTTRFLRARRTVDELIDAWREKGLREIGIRGYGSVFRWEWATPALSYQGGSLEYLQHKFLHYHERGARYYLSETSDNGGILGLGHYVSSRILWDVDEADELDALVDDFLDKAFGPARAPMARFYARINGDERPLARDNVVGYLYQQLEAARELAGDDEQVRARLADLVLYVRYLELFRDYELAEGDARQAAFERLIRHAYRMRESMMVHLQRLYGRRNLARSDDRVEIPPEAAWDVPEAENPWKSSEPFREAELERFVREGIARHADQSFAHADYVPRNPSVRYESSPGAVRVREDAAYLLHAREGEMVSVDVAAQLLDFSFTPGYLVLSPSGEIIDRAELVSVREDREIRFRAPETGTYRITFDNSTNTLRVTSTHPLAMLAQDYLGIPGRIAFKRPLGELFFQVPEGVETFEIKVAGEGSGELVTATLRDPRGEVVERQENISGDEPHHFNASRASADGDEIWSIELDRPVDAYFGDASLKLDDALPPVLATDADSVFVPE